MAEYPTFEEILALNPHLDKEEIEEFREILRKLYNAKTEGTRYTLALPFAHRHTSIDEDTGVDPRTVNLRRSR